MEIGPIFTASRDFRRARRKADLQEVIGHLTGRPEKLLSFDEVRQKLKTAERGNKSLQEIPLDAVVGSVGRYNDFTRTFLPRKESDKERWARVKASVDSMGLQPIDVYKVDQVYFVLDGHHRVSVAREIGATTILANVIEVATKVPLSPDDQPDDLIIKSEYAEFLEHTHLDKLRPRADMSVTVPGQYQVIEEQILAHRYQVSRDEKRDIPYEEEVVHWYDEIYSPVVRVIRERGILRDFPGRTETDLYVWISEHRDVLEDELGWEVSTQTATTDLVAQFSTQPLRVMARIGERLRDALFPDELAAGPPPGQWRQIRLASHPDDHLFSDLLVAINGKESGWCALEQALVIAQLEGARLHGLHVVSAKARLKLSSTEALKAEFDERCQSVGVLGELAVETGRTPRIVCDRARWIDLVILSLNYPPAPEMLSRLSSGMSAIIRGCPRPLLVVPGTKTGLSRPLLAYDGSPKSQEALFVAAYVSTRWEIELVVVNVQDSDHDPSEILDRARGYLDEQGSQAIFVERRGAIAEQILRTSHEYESDLIIMGGYGYNPVMEIVLGSAVDEILRTSRLPLLICR